MPTFTLDTIYNPPSESLQPIHNGLVTYDRAQLPDRAPDESCRVAVLARDETGTIIGGIVGELFYDWLHVTTLWVDESCRKQYVGSQLINTLEEAAVGRAIFHSHLETTSFQALGFYQKHGYEVFGKLEGKPAGHTWYYLKKDLEEKS
jgi:ribosomal protein S18 acetylase RimI-like enzyme